MKKIIIGVAITATIVVSGINSVINKPNEKVITTPIAITTVKPTTMTTTAEVVETTYPTPAITTPSGIEVIPVEPEEEVEAIPVEPTEPEPAITEPEKVEEEPIHTHTFGEWVVVKEATCITKSEEIRECSECGFQQHQTGNRIKLALTTKTKIIDGVIVEYLSCANCDEDTTHLPSGVWYDELGFEGSKGIRSITLLDNEICKIVIIPLDTNMNRSECYITNKTDEKLYLMSEGSYLVKDVPAGETVVKNVVEPIAEGTTIKSGTWQRNCYTLDDGVYIECVFVPDNRIDLTVSISNLNPYK